MSVHDKYLFTLQKPNNRQSCQHADILRAVLSSATYGGLKRSQKTSKVKQYLRKQITLNLVASVNYD